MDCRACHRLGLTLWLLLTPVPAVLAQISATFLQATSDTTDTNAYTFASQDLGAAASDRWITVISGGRKSGTTNCTAPTVTVASITATVVVSQGNNATNCNIGAIHKVLVPTGTSGTITVTYPATMLRSHIMVYRSTGPQMQAATVSGSSTAGDPTGTLTIAANGYAVGGALTATSTTTTWAGLTEVSDDVAESVLTVSGALLTPSTLQSGLTVTADFAAAGVESVGVWAAWAPITNASAPTHWVAANGNASSNCTEGDPCTWARSFALAGTATLPAGSWVHMACGIYSQAQINPTVNASPGFPIKWVGATTAADCVRSTGTRTALPAAGWSLSTDCSGTCTYTYEHAFDEATLYTVANVAQRPNMTDANGRLNVSTWVPIEVDDRASPLFATPSFRVFHLVQPVRYTQRFTVADVEAQHCTFFHSTAANKLYIHHCSERAPSDADNFYAGSTGWGTIDLEADDYWFENINWEQTTGQGLLTQNAATRFTGVNLRGMASQFWFQGTHHTLSGLTVSQVYGQGDAGGAECYSAQYGGGGANARSCWNAQGDGNQIVFGEPGTGFSYTGTVTNIRAERGWNGIQVWGSYSIDGAVVWGIANHGGFGVGSNVTLRNYICAASQDCWYTEGWSWENHVYEHNLFYNGTLFWANRDGNSNDIVAPTTWTFRYNIVANVNTDVRTQPTRDGDCNVWLPRNATHTWLGILPVDGVGSNPLYDTLAEIQAGTDDEDNSVSLAHTAWTNGSVFRNFTSQENALDFTLASASPLTVCGVRAGPANLALFGLPRRYRFRLPVP